MAIKGSEIRNALTGQRIKFLQTSSDTNGSFLEMIATYEKKSTVPPVHYHPYQEEFFEIISGELSVRINGEVEVLGPGHQLCIPKGISHTMWNDTSNPTVIRWRVAPALDTEKFLETVTTLGNDGKIGANGKAGMFQLALTINRFDKVFRLSRPPYILQKIFFLLLSPFANFFGYRAEEKCEALD
ncbi:MAG TPA: cupin domain-containing protein [Chitinophagaceae bacterium]|nr:cupin domain-containing protein [Chitinophagaceae bacterium]